MRSAASAPSTLQRATAPDAASAFAGVAPALPGTGRPAMSLAHPQLPAPVVAAPAPAPAPVMQRIVAEPSPASRPAAPVVQASAAVGGGGGGGAFGVTATPVVQRVDGAAPAAPAGGERNSDPELDELARAIFGRIRTHLRAEVIHEREAKGLSFDAF
jgi:hypothetical protein